MTSLGMNAQNTVTDAAALLFARGGGYLSVFDKPQRDAFARPILRPASSA
jgi:hypothetical protein